MTETLAESFTREVVIDRTAVMAGGVRHTTIEHDSTIDGYNGGSIVLGVEYEIVYTDPSWAPITRVKDALGELDWE